MRIRLFPLLVMTLSLVPLTARANDIERGKENYSAIHRTTAITIDGNLSEWDTSQFWKDTKFYIPKGSGTPDPPTGTLVTFEQCDACGFGGSWTGPDDASSAFSIAWDLDYLYIGVVVIDDFHFAHGGDGGPWDGDTLQMAFTDAARTTITNLYNVGLAGTNDAFGGFDLNTAGGPMIVGDVNERSKANGLGNPTVPYDDPTRLTLAQNVSIVRDTASKKTSYELRIPAPSLGYAKFSGGMQIGVGLCLNDGDDDSRGQSGWSGWGAHSIVFGKTASEAGLVTLQTGALEVTREHPSNLAMDVPMNTSIEADVTENGMSVGNGTVVLKLDGQAVSPPATVTRNGNVVSVTYQPPIALQRARIYNVELDYKDTTGKNYSKTWAFTSTFFNPGTLFIEAEDFNDFGDYVTDQPIGMTGPYPGGSYQDHFAAAEQDYHGGGGWRQYRDSSVTISIDKPNADGLHRGAFNVQNNWIVVANRAGDWLKHTREFPSPAKTYNVYARLASGGQPMNASLDLGLPDQTVTNLGTFSAPATGNWDVFRFVPLRDAQANVINLQIGGVQTLTFTVLPGDLDFNYLAFIPVHLMTIKPNANGSVTIDWTNGGTLESADDVQGPYTTTGNSTGSVTIPKGQLGLHKFYRVKE